MAKDVVTFLSWAAEPEHDERKKYGIKAVIIFSVLTAISLYVKRFKWGPIKNRKIRAYTCLSLLQTVTDLNAWQSTTLLEMLVIRNESSYSISLLDSKGVIVVCIIIIKKSEHIPIFIFQGGSFE